MSDCVVRIERLANGYEVELKDPKIVEQNIKTSNKIGTPWKDPMVSYAFKTVAEVISFLEKNLETAMPMDEYESSFDLATKEEEDDE